MEKTGQDTKIEYFRPPVVTIMGHVDHGKTSILDTLRHAHVVDKEYGGITQHIGAYQIEHNSKKITFIDTPGHAAFTQMRSRGGKAADIVVLVVAADEGVKPQTVEAISHAKAAGVPIIVAINKIDKVGANSQKVKQELAQHNILVEDWGGDVISVEVSAKENKNMDGLLDAILLVAELAELRADPKGELEATIVESRLDRQKGVIVSCIIKNGTLHIGDKVSASGGECKVKSIMDDKGAMVTEAGPSKPVEILGFSKVPNVGDLILTIGSELAELAVDENRVEIIGKNAKKTIAVVLKADTQGTLEAVKSCLADLVSSSVGASFALKFLHCSTGDITESDAMLAQSTKGVVLGFNVKVSPSIAEFSDTHNIPIKSYKAIYELIDDAKNLLEGKAISEEKKIKGRAKVIQIFKLASGDLIVGSKVIAGALKPNARVAIYAKDPADITEKDEPIYRGSIKRLRQGKDEVAVVGKDNECGVLLKPIFLDIQPDMWIEVK